MSIYETLRFAFESVDEDAKQPSLVGGIGSIDLDFYTTVRVNPEKSGVARVNPGRLATA